MAESVLIVDDNPDNLGVLEGILSAEGYDVRAALSGEIALRAIGARMPDLVLLDIMMPEMDGFEVCKRIRANPAAARVPVLFISALTDTDEKLKAFEAGGLDYITKPFQEREVLARVHTHLRLAAANRDLALANSELSAEIGARRLAEEVSIENNFRLFQILERIPVPTLVIGRDHRITHWNNALEHLTGLPAVQMIGSRDHWKFFHPSETPMLADTVLDLTLDAGRQDLFNHMAQEGYRASTLSDGAYEGEVFFPHCGAEGIWFFSMASPLVDRGGATSGAIQTLIETTTLKKTEQRLQASEEWRRLQNIMDEMSGLYNDRHFSRQLEYEVGRALRYSLPLALIVIQIDDLNPLIQTRGEASGDRIVHNLGRLLGQDLRTADTAYRYAPNRFAVLLPETPGGGALLVAERLRKLFEKENHAPSAMDPIQMTISGGVCEIHTAEKPVEYLQRTELALSQAIAQGQNRIFFG